MILRRRAVIEQEIIEALAQRDIRVKINGRNLHSVTQLDPPAKPPGLSRVCLKENKLIWSAVIAFPESSIFNKCVKSFHEDITFLEILKHIFESIHGEWDTEKRYTVSTVNVYFKNEFNWPFRISITSSLAALQHPRYFLDSGVPHFFILPKDSEIEEDFLDGCLLTSQ